MIVSLLIRLIGQLDENSLRIAIPTTEGSTGTLNRNQVYTGRRARIVLSPSAFRQSTGRCGRRRDRRTSAAVRRPFLIFSLIQRRGMQCWCGSDTLVRGI